MKVVLTLDESLPDFMDRLAELCAFAGRRGWRLSGPDVPPDSPPDAARRASDVGSAGYPFAPDTAGEMMARDAGRPAARTGYPDRARGVGQP